MTCREFKHSAASHNLWELSQIRDEQVLGHAESCESCGSWLRKQRTLAVSMQTLQARTAGLEAGANVERALLRAFRQDTLRNADSVLLGVKEGNGSSRPAVTPLSTPMLSRFFEIGAYVALAAAILVGVFLGVRILRQSSNAAQAQSHIAPSSVEPLPQKPATAAAQNVVASAEHTQPPIAAHKPSQPVRSSERGVAAAAANVTNDDAQSLAEVDYTPLMFCDPLSCAADTQVVRVELPAGANGQDSQPQMADLVVGYDGVVRAARMVK
jgi:hypothetical protein